MLDSRYDIESNVSNTQREQLARMFFYLKEILSDCDDPVIKAEVMEYLQTANQLGTPLNFTECLTIIEKIMSLVKPSFSARCDQAKIDMAIIDNIDNNIDSFRKVHTSRVEKLMAEVTEIVEDEIETAKREILKKLDPATIQQRFSNEGDFHEWIAAFNENYKTLLSNSVNRKVRNMMRNYVSEAEITSKNINSYIIDRKVVMDSHDHFYSSIAMGKMAIVNNTKTLVSQMSQYNLSLSQASDNLFQGIWREKQKFIMAQRTTALAAGVIGGVSVGIGVGVALASSATAVAATAGTATTLGSIAAAAAPGVVGTAVGAAASAIPGVGAIASPILGTIASEVTGAAISSGTAVSATSAGAGTAVAATAASPLIPIVIGLVAAVAIGFIAYQLYAAIRSRKFQEQVRICQQNFISEVENSTRELKRYLSESITNLFEQEFKYLEQGFYEFRTSSFIDSQKVLQLENNFLFLEKELEHYAKR